MVVVVVVVGELISFSPFGNHHLCSKQDQSVTFKAALTAETYDPCQSVKKAEMQEVPSILPTGS